MNYENNDVIAKAGPRMLITDLFWVEIFTISTISAEHFDPIDSNRLKLLIPVAVASQFILGQQIPLSLWLSLAPVVLGVSMASRCFNGITKRIVFQLGRIR
ncbi:hypothetical protein CASFOL_039494 [Castilleja foliolosa]|uniref:Uncharacterized protein n=1 Tax=Castilleja foliolosa TaxID=1961234 RepID=A0ABD3BI31_9LAMI